MVSEWHKCPFCGMTFTKRKPEPEPPEAVPRDPQPSISIRELIIDDPVCNAARVRHYLHDAGIRTIGDLLGKSRADILRMKNLGYGSLRQIEAALEKRGLGLRL